MVKISCFQCRGCGFHPWSGKLDPTCCVAQPKSEKKKKKKGVPDLTEMEAHYKEVSGVQDIETTS